MEFVFKLVDTTDALKSAATSLARASTLFIDTEFECRRGETTLCLLQISSGDDIYLIDCLRLTAMDCLAEAITGPDTEWVLHDGSKDIGLILAKLGLGQPPKIFDTQVAWGLLNPERAVSLVYVIYKVLGIRTAKEHQADPWNLRPIPDAQLEYAASDIEYLPGLRAKLGQALEQDGKAELIHPVSREFCASQDGGGANRKAVTTDDFRKAWELDYDGQAALRFLIDWYNNLSDEEVPSGIKPYVLFLIARRLPESGQELAAIKGVPSGWARREGDVLMGRMIRATYEAREDEYPALEAPPYVTFQEIRAKAWLAIVRWFVCKRLVIAPDIAFPKWLMDRLQERNMKTGDMSSGTEEFSGWRKDWLSVPYEECCRKLQTLLPYLDDPGSTTSHGPPTDRWRAKGDHGNLSP